MNVTLYAVVNGREMYLSRSVNWTDQGHDYEFVPLSEFDETCIFDKRDAKNEADRHNGTVIRLSVRKA